MVHSWLQDSVLDKILVLGHCRRLSRLLEDDVDGKYREDDAEC